MKSLRSPVAALRPPAYSSYESPRGRRSTPVSPTRAILARMPACIRSCLLAMLVASPLGCGSRSIFLSPPTPASDERSALLAVHDEEAGIILYASDLSHPIRFEDSGTTELRFEWLFYTKTLEELDLNLGVVPPPEENESGLAISDWSRSFEALAEDDADWRLTTSISSTLAAHRLPGDACSGLDHKHVTLSKIGPHEQGRALAVIDSERLLVTASRPFASYIVYRDGRIEPVSLGPFLDARQVHAAVTERDGVVWLAFGQFHGVYRVTFSDPVVVENTPDLNEDALALAVELDANHEPVVHVGSEKNLYRLDEDRWTLVQTFGAPGSDDLLLATDGPDHLVTAAETASVTIHFERGQRSEFPYPARVNRPKLLAFGQPLGLLLGTQESTIWRFDRAVADWSLVGDFGTSEVIRIVNHRGGFVAGFKETPDLAEYHAERGLCRLRQLPLLDTRSVVSWGDELVALPRRALPSTGLQILRIPVRR